MYIIKSHKKNQTIWDSENCCPLCQFKDGIFETDNKIIAEKLRTIGYDMECDMPEELYSYAGEKENDLDAIKTIYEPRPRGRRINKE